MEFDRALMTNLPAHLRHAANAAVLAHVAPLSAHSDVASLLLEAVQPLGDAHLFCPDSATYRYVLAHTRGVVFGFAAGMGTIAFRLDGRMGSRALATGGKAVPECGGEWVAVVHPRPDADWPEVDVEFWARKAYVHAREIGAGLRRPTP